jgi:hypothetical protein
VGASTISSRKPMKNCHRAYSLKDSNSGHWDLWDKPFYRWSRGLTPKGRSLVFGPFLKFGQAIVDALFVHKISNFWWTCGLVLASRRTNFYKILIFGLGTMLQKQNPSELRAARAAKKLFIFQLFWVGFFSINS